MEEWRDIEGYEGGYQVSNLGRVKRLAGYRQQGFRGMEYQDDKIISARIHKGYPVVTLCRNGGTKTVKIHRLIAEAFIPNPNNLPFVNYRDEDRANNNIDNLEWCTPQYNTAYSRGIVIKICDNEWNVIEEYNSLKECSKNYNFTPEALSYHISKGKDKFTCKGYNFKVN